EPYHFHGIQQAWSLGTEVSFYVFLPLYATSVRRLSAGVRARHRLALELGLVALLCAIELASRFVLMTARGEDTYSLTTLPVYLYHPGTPTGFFTGAFPLMLGGTAAITLAIAAASYLVVERPALRLKGPRA